MPKAAPSVVSPLQPNDSGSQISTAIDLPPVARGLKLLSRVGLRFAQNALKTDHGFLYLNSVAHEEVKIVSLVGIQSPIQTH